MVDKIDQGFTKEVKQIDLKDVENVDTNKIVISNIQKKMMVLPILKTDSFD